MKLKHQKWTCFSLHRKMKIRNPSIILQEYILCSYTQKNTLQYKKNQKNIEKFNRELNPDSLCISIKIFSIFQPSFLISCLELRTVDISTLQR